MRSFISLLILCFFIFSQLGCSGNAVSDNANVPVAAANTESNTNLTPASTPLPEFADANEALTVGTKLLENGETDLSIEAFNQAVKLDPELAEAYFQLGVAYALVEARDAAKVYSEQPTPTVDPKAKKPKEKKTNSIIAFEKAVDAYKKLIAKNPDDDLAYFNLGRSYNKLNKDEDAAKSLRQAVKLKPDDTQYQTELGAILIKLAKYGEAVGALKKALELDAENSKATELLDDAEAGQKRIAFTAVKKDDKTGKSSSNANSNTEPIDDEAGKPELANTAKKPAPPANKPK